MNSLEPQTLPHFLFQGTFYLLLSSPVFKQTLGNKLDHLFEITTISNEQKISETDLPLVNPYHAFAKKPILVLKSIKTLIKQPVRIAKEYVQASSFDQYPILSTSQE